MREIKSLIIVKSLLAIMLISTLSGCLSIPLSNKLPITTNLAVKRMSKTVLIYMDEKQAKKKVIKYAQYVIPIGKAINSNTENVMNMFFDNVKGTISQTNPGKYDYKLTINLIDQKIKMGPAIYSTHTVYLKICYDLFDSENNQLFSQVYEGHGSNKMTEKEILDGLITKLTTTNILLYHNQSDYKNSVGYAFDLALVQVMNKLYASMNEFCN